jgi:hypothetical protein
MTNAIANGPLSSWCRWAHLLYDTLAGLCANVSCLVCTLDRRRKNFSLQLLFLNMTSALATRSRTHYGELVFSDTQDRIGRHDLTGAWAELEKFKPMNETNPSTLENRLMQEEVPFLKRENLSLSGQLQRRRMLSEASS